MAAWYLRRVRGEMRVSRLVRVSICVWLAPLGDVAKPLDVVDGVAAWKRVARGAVSPRSDGGGGSMARPETRAGAAVRRRLHTITCVRRARADVALNWRSFALAS